MKKIRNAAHYIDTHPWLGNTLLALEGIALGALAI